MATVHVTLSRVDDRGDTGGSVSVLTSEPTAKQTFASSSSNQVSTIAAARADGLFWKVTSKGDVWVSFGAAPDASTDADDLVLAGQSQFWSVTTAGEKIAVVDA